MRTTGRHNRLPAIRDPDTVHEIDAPYLGDILGAYFGWDDLEILSVARETLQPGFIGRRAQLIWRFRLRCRRGDRGEHHLSLVMKAGVNTALWREEVAAGFRKLGYSRLADQARVHKSRFRSGLPIEIPSYRTFVPQLPIGTPRIFHTVCDEGSGRYWIFMEDLSSHLHVDSRYRLGFWTEGVMERVIAQMATMHSFFWNDPHFFAQYPHFRRWSATWFASTLPYWEEVRRAGVDRCSRFISRKQAGILEKITRNLVEICTRIDRGHHTAVHGDFSPMNLCFRRRGEGEGVVLYDWGSAAIHVPQFDLHYFINFVVDPKARSELAARLVDFYLEALDDTARRSVSREDFMEVYNLSALRYLGTRELAACSLSDEKKHPWMFRTLAHNLSWAEMAADRYL